MSPDLDGGLAQIEDMYMKGVLPRAQYFQCLVTLAARYLTEEHDAETALKLLNRCDPEYFKNECIKQMQTDPLFATATVELVYVFERLGISNDVVYKTTVPPASA